MDGIPQWVRGVTSRQAHVGLPPGTVEEEQELAVEQEQIVRQKKA